MRCTKSKPAQPPPRFPYVRVQLSPTQIDEVSTELWELEAVGIEQRDHDTLDDPTGAQGTTLLAFFSDAPSARRAARALVPRYEAEFDELIGDAWRDAWRDRFRPTRVGPRLWLCPSWDPVDPAPGEAVVTIDPGRAFGSGTHETTRLVLRELDRRVQGGERVLDVGCGSGILGVAALLLGAHHVDAIDIDGDAIGVADTNARLNGVEAHLRASTTPLGAMSGQWDLVLANIESSVLTPMAMELITRVRGFLVLSGILVAERDEVVRAFCERGVDFDGASEEGEWTALVFRAER